MAAKIDIPGARRDDITVLVDDRHHSSTPVLATDASLHKTRSQQAGHLVELSATPGLIEWPAPIVGQHTRELLAENGYHSDEIDALLDAGVVAQA